jgi:RNA recognition motif-containing protein
VRSFGDGYRLRAEMARKNMYVREGGDRPGDRPVKTYRTEAGPAAGGSGSSFGDRDRNNDNPPCDTLFIGNVSPSVSDEEIAAYFRSVKGDLFKACKVNRNNNRVSAFVQFVDVPTAQEVHESEQGKELPGSDRGPMRIQFSRNALGATSKRYRDDDGGYMPRHTPTPNSDISPGDGSVAAYGQTPDGAPQHQSAPQQQPMQSMQPVQIIQAGQVMQAPVSQPGEYAPPPDALQFQAAQGTYQVASTHHARAFPCSLCHAASPCRFSAQHIVQTQRQLGPLLGR